MIPSISPHVNALKPKPSQRRYLSEGERTFAPDSLGRDRVCVMPADVNERQCSPMVANVTRWIALILTTRINPHIHTRTNERGSARSPSVVYHRRRSRVATEVIVEHSQDSPRCREWLEEASEHRLPRVALRSCSREQRAGQTWIRSTSNNESA